MSNNNGNSNITPTTVTNSPLQSKDLAKGGKDAFTKPRTVEGEKNTGERGGVADDLTQTKNQKTLGKKPEHKVKTESGRCQARNARMKAARHILAIEGDVGSRLAYKKKLSPKAIEVQSHAHIMKQKIYDQISDSAHLLRYMRKGTTLQDPDLKDEFAKCHRCKHNIDASEIPTLIYSRAMCGQFDKLEVGEDETSNMAGQATPFRNRTHTYTLFYHWRCLSEAHKRRLGMQEVTLIKDPSVFEATWDQVQIELQELQSLPKPRRGPRIKPQREKTTAPGTMPNSPKRKE
ncbi:uncharacterized protein EV420DRAFT_1486042 [Desarmillaria tabescens]|uniref:Uncharacterized protein n=1 Tax=Armillaria tabescens TaxID=1929756 RepID=A0AA39JF68_ARMTA|nr:uncharacterized protein EV420DRAFT_1486042 [Desarmillaria tabescens]KAK0440214.1 hypothetical protein EV420DRAFT_1486042 [Desarmillaria tabescens]